MKLREREELSKITYEELLSRSQERRLETQLAARESVDYDEESVVYRSLSGARRVSPEINLQKPSIGRNKKS